MNLLSYNAADLTQAAESDGAFGCRRSAATMLQRVKLGVTLSIPCGSYICTLTGPFCPCPYVDLAGVTQKRERRLAGWPVAREGKFGLAPVHHPKTCASCSQLLELNARGGLLSATADGPDAAWRGAAKVLSLVWPKAADAPQRFPDWAVCVSVSLFVMACL